jgi:hypothetical protein
LWIQIFPKKYGLLKNIQFARLKTGLNKWDIVNDSKHHAMCLVDGLYSSDCITDHAVLIAGNWIFDSNFEFALPLCKESLDLYCSSDLKTCTFKGVTHVCMPKQVVNAPKKEYDLCIYW